MNVTSSLQTANAASQSLLARSLTRLPNLATALAADDSDNGLSTDSSSDATQSLSAQLQSGITGLQSTGSQLDSLSDLLKQMGTLAQQASDSSSSASAQAEASQKFAALQEQLRSIISDSGSFGPSADGSVNPANLQQGPMLALIAQSSDGAFSLSAADAASTVSDVSGQVSQASSAVTKQTDSLTQEAIRLQIGQQNLASVLAPLQNSADAQQANTSLIGSILSQGGNALNLQGAPNADAALQLVQF